jgi:cobyrinic acid a,c-diamide synthase
MPLKGLVIAGTSSGCGKTTISLGFLAALVKRGLKVAPFKVGPDFIDPGHHSRITGVTSRNLDGWMLSKKYNLECFRNAAATADITVVEGVMGLFDGYDGKNESGSTAQMAKWLGLPTILVVNAKSMARSAAAVVMGFERFDEDLSYAGVIFNNLGSKRHLHYLTEAVMDNIKMPCLGGIIRDEDLAIPERHLGLITREDHPLTDQIVDKLAGVIENGIDLDGLLENLPELGQAGEPLKAVSPKRSKRVRIGIARDNAFCFYYQDNLDLLEASGAELSFFSPVADKQVPPDLDGLYFGGGYPELFADQLAANTSMRKQIRDKSRKGMPIYAECGGFMYLCAELRDRGGKRFPMVGCFPFATQMFSRLKALGYREITLTKDTIFGRAGQSIRGHEFHYSELIKSTPDIDTVFRLADKIGMQKPPEGFMVNCTLGSYNHLHFGSRPQVAEHFVDVCRNYRNERN